VMSTVHCDPRVALCPTWGCTGRISRLPKCVCSSGSFSLRTQGCARCQASCTSQRNQKSELIERARQFTYTLQHVQLFHLGCVSSSDCPFCPGYQEDVRPFWTGSLNSYQICSRQPAIRSSSPSSRQFGSPEIVWCSTVTQLTLCLPGHIDGGQSTPLVGSPRTSMCRPRPTPLLV
jgi:hypothetical protein